MAKSLLLLLLVIYGGKFWFSESAFSSSYSSSNCLNWVINLNVSCSGKHAFTQIERTFCWFCWFCCPAGDHRRFPHLLMCALLAGCLSAEVKEEFFSLSSPLFLIWDEDEALLAAADDDELLSCENVEQVKNIFSSFYSNTIILSSVIHSSLSLLAFLSASCLITLFYYY